MKAAFLFLLHFSQLLGSFQHQTVDSLFDLFDMSPTGINEHEKKHEEDGDVEDEDGVVDDRVTD